MRQYKIPAILLLFLILSLPLHAEEHTRWLPFLPEWLEMGLFLIAIILVPVVVIIIFVGMWRKVFSTIWYIISLQPLRRRLLRNKLSNQMEYYRDIPAEGDLQVANHVLNSVSSAWIADYQGLFGALILRLINQGALLMRERATRYGVEPRPVLSIGHWPDQKRLDSLRLSAEEKYLEKQFFLLLKGAAGNDGILQPRELQQYLRTNSENHFLADLKTFTEHQKAAISNQQTAVQLLAMKKYLVDASLIKERGLAEASLWREYLVYAILFGVADKVCENFAEVYPDFFQTNVLASAQLNIVGNNGLKAYVSAAIKGMEDADSK
jgi:hypothetical protein